MADDDVRRGLVRDRHRVRDGEVTSSGVRVVGERRGLHVRSATHPHERALSHEPVDASADVVTGEVDDREVRAPERRGHG